MLIAQTLPIVETSASWLRGRRSNAIQTINQPDEPNLVQTRSGTRLATSNSSYDLDAEDWRVTDEGGDDDGDQVPDVTFSRAAVSANSGALIAKLAAGTVPGPESCAAALESPVATVTALKTTDVICVRTTREAISALTISSVQASGTVYTVHFAYYAPEA